MAVKLTPDSLLTVDDQERLYREQLGAAAAERQIRARRRELGKCTCEPAKVRKRWQGSAVPVTRTIHQRECPRFAAWMGD